ncbi:HAD family phosphatase [Thermoleophilia bacterium SCSIO 60948]|nr:HAD family phosphatase [Thermoleophilia bacterium SCSIO 60948]
MSRVRAVISDFGGVLTTPLIHAFARVQEEHGISTAALGMALYALAERDGENPLHRLERGEMSEADFLAACAEEIERVEGSRPELGRFNELYFGALDPNAEMIGYMAELRDRGLRMAMLTNNVREWEARWRSMLPVDEIFELVVDSAFVGMRKPEPRIYELTLERLGLSAPECVFVDDIEVNVVAARELGMSAVLFETTEQARAEIDAALA